MAPKKPIKSAPKEQTQNLFESSPFSKADKKSPSTSASSIWEKFKAIILDEKTCFVIGVFTLFSVFFLFISFLSYFFTGSYDQSKMELPWREILSQRSEIHNWASVMGAILSELFINRWYGIASVSFLYFGLIIGLRLINVKVISVWKAGLHGVFWLIWISILCGFVFDPLLNDFLFFSLGGQHGDAISNQLVSFIGYPGVALLLLVCIVCYFALLNKSLILFIRGLFSKKSPQAISSDSIQETER